MNGIWLINNWKSMILIEQLSYKYNIKVGQQVPDFIFQEIAKKHPSWLTYCGGTELNAMELAREYASHKKKILYIKPKLDK